MSLVFAGVGWGGWVWYAVVAGGACDVGKVRYYISIGVWAREGCCYVLKGTFQLDTSLLHLPTLHWPALRVQSRWCTLSSRPMPEVLTQAFLVVMRHNQRWVFCNVAPYVHLHVSSPATYVQLQ